jgi:hypothetical protein
MGCEGKTGCRVSTEFATGRSQKAQIDDGEVINLSVLYYTAWLDQGRYSYVAVSLSLAELSSNIDLIANAVSSLLCDHLDNFMRFDLVNNIKNRGL